MTQENKVYFRKSLCVTVAFASGRLEVKVSSLIIEFNEKSHSFQRKTDYL